MDIIQKTPNIWKYNVSSAQAYNLLLYRTEVLAMLYSFQSPSQKSLIFLARFPLRQLHPAHINCFYISIGQSTLPSNLSCSPNWLCKIAV